MFQCGRLLWHGHWMRFWLFALGLSLAVPATGERSFSDRLASGEIIVRTEPAVDGVSKARMEAVIDVPPERVWSIIDRCETYKDRFPRIADSREISREGDTVRCRVVVDLPWPMSDLSAITRATHTAAAGIYRRAWTLESGDYEINEGSWTLMPFGPDGRRTHAIYELRAKPKTGLPELIREQAQARALPDVIKALRKHLAP